MGTIGNQIGRKKEKRMDIIHLSRVLQDLTVCPSFAPFSSGQPISCSSTFKKRKWVKFCFLNKLTMALHTRSNWPDTSQAGQCEKHATIKKVYLRLKEVFHRQTGIFLRVDDVFQRLMDIFLRLIRYFPEMLSQGQHTVALAIPQA